MGNATRCKVSKIEARNSCVSDDELIYLARALGVSTEELYPDFIRCAQRLYDAICTSKASRFSCFILVSVSCSKFGACAFDLMFSLASV